MQRRQITRVLVAPVLLALALVAAPARTEALTRGPHRIAGADRYQTSVDLSLAAFPNGAATAVLASGAAFPDGLAAGPLAAFTKGPVLLTPPEGLPPQVGDELRRLGATTVLVIGGPAAVHEVVLDHVAAATGGIRPRRIAGDDRYATAARVAAEFPAGLRTVVASGTAFPDALAGGALAAMLGGPLVLVAPDAVPEPVAQQLARLAPPEVRVLGGPAAVSDATFSAVARFTRAARRLAGPDRWSTAAAIARDFGTRPTEVLVASGASFADALAATGLAAVRRGPILLTDPSCAPSATVEVVRGWGWPDLTIVGGTASVRPLAASVLPCRPVPDGLLAPGVTFTTQVLPGPRVVRILTVDRRQGHEIRPTTATGRLAGRLRSTDVARRWGAVAAVNGGFFRTDGTPSYAFAEGGRLLRFPGDVPAGETSTLVGFDPAKTGYGFFGAPQPWARLVLPGTVEVNVGRVNQGPPISDEAVLLTPENAQVFPAGEWCRAQLAPTANPALDPAAPADTVQPYAVVAAGCSSDPIPRTSDVAVAPPGSVAGEALRALAPGARVGFTWRLHPTSEGVFDVIGSNVTLVFGGRVSDAVRQGTGTFFSQRADRTAIAQRPNGDLLIVTVDGRQSGYSIGMTPAELADHLVGLGAVDAANLDGGGSTTMVVGGLLANRPSDPSGERPVGNGLVVVPRGTFPPPGVRAQAAPTPEGFSSAAATASGLRASSEP